MSDSKKGRRLWYAIGGAVIVAFLAYGATSFKTELTPYVGFQEAISTGHHVQVAGSLVQGSSRYDEASKKLVFSMADENGRQLEVEYDGVKPGNFEDATQVVVIGAYRDGVFKADQLLVKCPSKYQGLEESGQSKRS